jgi:hypothetical protein
MLICFLQTDIQFNPFYTLDPQRNIRSQYNIRKFVSPVTSDFHKIGMNVVLIGGKLVFIIKKFHTIDNTFMAVVYHLLR